MRAISKFAEVETLKNIDESRASWPAWSQDEFRALSLRTKTEERQGEVCQMSRKKQRVILMGMDSASLPASLSRVGHGWP